MGDSSVGWDWPAPAGDWAGGEASETGADPGPKAQPGESAEPLISAVLVVAVMGRWGIRVATGALRSCGKSSGGEIFPNTTCSSRTDLEDLATVKAI